MEIKTINFTQSQFNFIGVFSESFDRLLASFWWRMFWCLVLAGVVGTVAGCYLLRSSIRH